MIIAIDGPAASGKSTIAKLLAKDLDYLYIDTGAMYRAVTFAFLEAKLGSELNFELNQSQAGTEAEDEALLARILTKIKIRLESGDSGAKVFLNDRDISSEIRGSLVSANVAYIAAFKVVRDELVEQQRAMGKCGHVVLDGRDIGTVVFPQAELKIFMIASAEVRAQRRIKDLEARGEKPMLAELIEDIKARDEHDYNRKESPLTKAADAKEIDTDNFSIDEVLEQIKKLIN